MSKGQNSEYSEGRSLAEIQHNKANPNTSEGVAPRIQSVDVGTVNASLVDSEKHEMKSKVTTEVCRFAIHATGWVPWEDRR